MHTHVFTHTNTDPPYHPHAGVRQELLGLMRVPGMNAARARVLYKAGIKDPQALAVADPASLEKVLAQGLAQQLKGRPRSGDKKVGCGGWAVSFAKV